MDEEVVDGEVMCWWESVHGEVVVWVVVDG